MKKSLLLVLSSLMVCGVAVAQDEAADYRSEWAKSQDMYIEPTLRITETTIPVTPEQAAQQNLSTREVPVGTATAQDTTTVVTPDGQAVQQPSAAPTRSQGAPVQDLSRPVQ